MKPLMIGPDGSVGSATRREMAHLVHCLERDVKARPSKVANRNVTSQTPCSCGGSNENCARCFGRGFIEAGHNRSARSKKLGGRTQSTPLSYDALVLSAAMSSAEGAVKCPACEFKGSTDAFTRHFAAVHGSKRTTRGPQQIPVTAIPISSRAASRAPITNCPLCNCQIRGDKLQKHVSSRCPSRPDKPKLPISFGRQRAGEGHGISEVFQRLQTSGKRERASKALATAVSRR